MVDLDVVALAGAIDAVDNIKVSGWLIEQTRAKSHLKVDLYIDGEFVGSTIADGPREDVTRIGHPSPHVGFTFLVPKHFSDGRIHEVTLGCEGQLPVWLPGPNGAQLTNSWTFQSLGESVATASFSSEAAVIVHLDYVAESGVSGWAYDERDVHRPPTLTLYIDGDLVERFVADKVRNDVRASGFAVAEVGFFVPVPDRFLDANPHTLWFEAPDGDKIQVETSSGKSEDELRFTFPRTKILGKVDGLHGGAIRGWALAHDRPSGRKLGGLQVMVTLQGHPVGQVLANQSRMDVAEAHGSDPNCGFVFVPPNDLVLGRAVTLKFVVVPDGTELENSPLPVTFFEAHTYRAIRELEATADELLTRIWSLRAALRDLKPAESFSLLNYDAWAKAYFAALAVEQPLRELAVNDDGLPLVTIICPAYRPRLKDFMAAIKSVIDQTYTTWELIIVDDASADLDLRDAMNDFSANDKRIRNIFLQKNVGISAATNAAIAEARGGYIALFDHDDLLVKQALEFMVAAAITSKAKVLYSDEDKIDDDGVYSEVHLKPDWNYRLLLSQNYVCHLLMIEAAHLRSVGLLRPEYDGAQDHDLILRLAAATPANLICHVSKILYHWRKTPFSTASSGRTKPYAVDAGIRAVADHLSDRRVKAKRKPDRFRIRATVSAPFESTIFQTRWSMQREPSVTIVIPFRDHIEMTERCLLAIREHTEYRNYEIILVDNWSSSEESFSFSRRVEQHPGVRILRVEEPFNYSRLNNLAAAQTASEFLLFLNNDVLITAPGWLTQMVGEVLADPGVGIVGGKLLYPSGLVQHGGVVLGVGGIADHAFRGLALHDPGYMARAICTQEMSAVTAACMLCRREVFEKVGGFDEIDLRVAFNDVDLCLKVGQQGYRIVMSQLPLAEHHESLSRGSDLRPDQQARFYYENQVMQSRWGHVLRNDPYYNVAFSRRSGLFYDLKGASG